MDSFFCYEELHVREDPLMKTEIVELVALTTARDVLQKQIDERVALRRQEMLLADSFYRERKTRRLSGLKRNGR